MSEPAVMAGLGMAAESVNSTTKWQGRRYSTGNERRSALKKSGTLFRRHLRWWHQHRVDVVVVFSDAFKVPLKFEIPGWPLFTHRWGLQSAKIRRTLDPQVEDVGDGLDGVVRNEWRKAGPILNTFCAVTNGAIDFVIWANTGLFFFIFRSFQKFHRKTCRL